MKCHCALCNQCYTLHCFCLPSGFYQGSCWHTCSSSFAIYQARLVKPPLATSSVRKHCWANISLASCAYLLFSIFLLFLLPASSSLLLGLPVHSLASITHLPASLFATIPSASPPAPLTALPTTRSSLLSSKI